MASPGRDFMLFIEGMAVILFHCMVAEVVLMFRKEVGRFVILVVLYNARLM